MNKPTPGLYKHFKSKTNLYEVLGTGFYEPDMEESVIYRECYGDHKTCVRKIAVWNQTVEHNGETLPRFRKMTDKEINDEMLIDKVGLFIIKDGKVLFARSKGKKSFYIPGGKREMGETDEECLKREIMEELGSGIVENSLQLYRVFYCTHPKSDGTDGILKLTLYFGTLTDKPKASREIEELKWFTSKDEEGMTLMGHLFMESLFFAGRIL